MMICLCILVMGKMQEVIIIETVVADNNYGCAGSNSGLVEEDSMEAHNSDGHASGFAYGDNSSLGTSEGGILPFMAA